MFLQIFAVSMLYFILYGIVLAVKDRKKFSYLSLKEYIKVAVFILGGLSVVASLFLTTVACVLIELSK